MKTPITQVAVLGAGTMGSQIAAHFANAGFLVLLFDLADEKGGNSLIEVSIQNLAKIEPLPLAQPEFSQFIEACNYQKDLSKLKKCQLIIEAVAENFAVKTKLYQDLAPYVHPEVILASNTSGLSIGKLAETLPEKIKTRFLGMHFFNPPRYLPLIELIPHRDTDAELFSLLSKFLTTFLGKQIVKARDTPNFIANRLGVFGLLITLYHAERLHIPLEVIDELTGTLIGRPKSATLRTLDLVGLDIFAHVVNTMKNELNADPWHPYFKLPEWFNTLLQDKALGQKTGKGIYQKTNNGLLIYDVALNSYRPLKYKANASFVKALAKDRWLKLWPTLPERALPEAQFLYAIWRDLFHYTAFHASTISDHVRDIDTAMRFGFGWQQGIFENWQSISWSHVRELINKDIAAKTTLSAAELPSWVNDITGAYQEDHAYAPATNTWIKPEHTPRQAYPMLAGQAAPSLDIIFEHKSAVAYTYQDALVLSFKTKLCTLNLEALASIQEALTLAETNHKGLIIWQKDSENFSAGADLLNLAIKFELGGIASLEKIMQTFQATMLLLRYAQVPVISAVRGYALGGGCELMMHSHKTVAALESYIGLVEPAIGLIPGAGGTKEMAYRASLTQNPPATLLEYFKQIATASVAKSAYQAKNMGYLRPDDIIIMNPQELLFVAYQELNALSTRPFVPKRPEAFKVEGLPSYANLLAALTNLKVGNFISEYDTIIAEKLAHVITGGAIAPSQVDSAWMLQLEREAFLGLIIDIRTQARIEHMLKTGKPLRN